MDHEGRNPDEDGYGAKDKGSQVPMKMWLKNLKMGKLDTGLFEIPAGYSKMGMGNPFGGGGFNMDEMMKDMGKGMEGE